MKGLPQKSGVLGHSTFALASAAASSVNVDELHFGFALVVSDAGDDDGGVAHPRVSLASASPPRAGEAEHLRGVATHDQNQSDASKPFVRRRTNPLAGVWVDVPASAAEPRACCIERLTRVFAARSRIVGTVELAQLPKGAIHQALRLARTWAARELR